MNGERGPIPYEGMPAGMPEDPGTPPRTALYRELYRKFPPGVSSGEVKYEDRETGEHTIVRVEAGSSNTVPGGRFEVVTRDEEGIRRISVRPGVKVQVSDTRAPHTGSSEIGVFKPTGSDPDAVSVEMLERLRKSQRVEAPLTSSRITRGLRWLRQRADGRDS